MDKTRHRTLVRILWLLILTMLATPLVYADVWTPQLNDQPIEQFVTKIGVYAIRLGAILIIGFAVVKIIHGRIEASTGISGIASRGHISVYEAFSHLFWFGVALVLLPFFLYFIASAGLLPQYVANEMSKIIQNIWNWHI
jgi:hypothetical protein